MPHESHTRSEEDDNIKEASDAPDEPAEIEEAEEKKPHRGEKAPQAGGYKLAGWWHWLMRHKKISVPVATVVLLGALAAVPFTRYAIAGLILKQSYAVLVLDAQTQKPVTSAEVSIGGAKAVTDNRGRATIKTSVGSDSLMISKKYYATKNERVLVPIGKPAQPHKVMLQATGRIVPITLLNAVGKQAVANITIKAEGAEAKTDKQGKAILVLPPDKKQVEATISGQGFNDKKVTVTVTGEEVAANAFEIAPAGKLYFLSNASGKLDLVKSDLDGGNRQTVLAGTGKEDRYNTILLASRDWKYVALLSKRDGGDHAKLFLIETDTDKLTTMDEGDADFTVVGWSGDRFVYVVSRAKLNYWDAKRNALKSFSASSKKITILDETSAVGDNFDNAYETIGTSVLVGQDILYAKTWSGSSGYSTKLDGKQSTFNTVHADGSQKKVLKTYDRPNNFSYIPLDVRTAELNELYIAYYDKDGNQKFDEYNDGKVTTTKLSVTDYYNGVYNTYSVSPSGDKTLWSEYRDGKNVVFVGDKQGLNGKQIGSSEDFTVYGWFTDDYVLLTKKGSEMRIMPAGSTNTDLEKSLKITDYYKPNYYSRGYNYGGYGG